MTFGNKLRLLRKSKKIGIRELSKKLRYDRSYLSRVENGGVTASDELIRAAAKCFRVREEELRIAAGKFPTDVLDILSNHPQESVSILRETLGEYGTNGDLFSSPREDQSPDKSHSKT
ncbi:MAG: helix-turn-helix transcriptional regulator, partial [Elusimicrobia bacterium]|nr:helix-turn-helix transcriptional regulator [Elusimicrobiota bacterium]